MTKKLLYPLLVVFLLLVIILPLTFVYAASEDLYPTGQVTWTNVDGSFLDLDDDPDAPDGNWADHTGGGDVTINVSFDAPTDDLTGGANLQEFRVLVRKTAVGGDAVTVDIHLYENGGFIADIGGGALTSTVGQVFSATWDADDLADISGVDVECYVFIAQTPAPASRCGDVGAVEWVVEYDLGIVLPTVTTQAATDVEDTTATGNGNITVTGGENCDIRGIVWDLATHGDPGNVAPGASAYANDVPDNGSFGVGAFTRSLTSLPTGDTIYARAYAHNSAGYAYGGEVNFLTKPAAPTNVSATDGAHSDKVVVTWTKSTGATGYKVYEGINLLDTLGDVATYDDNAAPSGTISNAGTVTASDGDFFAHVELSLAGESVADGASRTYKVVALNATGDSDASDTDTGYTTPGTIAYQWQRSAADADAAYGDIALGITDPYDDVGAPANGDGRYFQCVLSSADASNSPQTSDSDRGFRAAPPTVTTHVSDDIEDTTATGNGEIDAIGGENCTERGFVWSLNTHGDPGNISPAASDYENEQHDNGDYGVGIFDKAMTGLDTGDTIFLRAYAYNPTGGWDYGYEDSFLTKPAAPTNVAASDGTDETKVVITWTKSFGATDYHVFRGAVDLGPAGDVDTFDDNGATAGTITNAGTVTASDGTVAAHVQLSLAGEATGTTSHTYKVVASNATGDSDDSTTDDGYRSVGAITYQWQRSAADADAAYGNIVGATTDPYSDIAAPANGDGRWYLCNISSTNASNSPQESDHNRGYRMVTPTVTTQAVTNIEDTTATGNGNITATGDGNVDTWGVCWNLGGNPTTADNTAAGSGAGGAGAFTANLVGLPTGTLIHTKAYATNDAGTGYGVEEDCLTKPAAPTNVAATDGVHTDRVVITWVQSVGATDYHVWRDAVDLGASGDVATEDDAGADAPTITAGNSVATDGDSGLHVTLTLAGASANEGTVHVYKVVASNATGDSDDSLTDNGNRGVGVLTYQWQRSAGDGDAGYGNIGGATTDPYEDTAAPAPVVGGGLASASDGTSDVHVTLSIAGESGSDGDGRWFQCLIDATGAAQQTSASNRGYRGASALTYEWYRSAADADAAFGSILGEGGTTDPYNDTNGVVAPDGRWYYAIVGMTGAAPQSTTHNRGYIAAPPPAPTASTFFTSNLEGISALALILFISVALTCTMLATRQMMLGFAAALFWAIGGALAYALSAIPWGDIYFYIFFTSLLGMTTFVILAAYGLREKKDTLGDEEL